MSSILKVLGFLALTSVALQAAEPVAKDILSAALSKMSGATSFIGTSKSEKTVGKYDITTEEEIYQRADPDGTKLQRIETTCQMIGKDGGVVRSFVICAIINRGGSWLVDDKKKQAIHFSGLSTISQGMGEVSSSIGQNNNNSSLDLAETTLPSGVQCYKISMHLNLDADTQQTLKGSIQKTQATLFPEKTTDNAPPKDPPVIPLPGVVVYYIGKNDSLIWGKEMFSTVGDKMSSCIYSTLNVNVPVEDSLFEVPRGYTQSTSDSMQDLFHKAITK